MDAYGRRLLRNDFPSYATQPEGCDYQNKSGFHTTSLRGVRRSELG